MLILTRELFNVSTQMPIVIGRAARSWVACSGSLFVAALLAGCAPQAATDEPAKSAVRQNIASSSTSTTAVLDRNTRAFAARDVDGLMENYTDQSVLITQEATYQGKAQIRAFFDQLVAEFDSRETTFTMQQRRVRESIAFIAWTAETPARRYELGTDTFYIANDRILYQTYAFKASVK